MFYSLLYISDHLLAPAVLAREVDAIVATSLRRNAALQVTGALVATPDRFAQVLEGSQDHVEALLAGIVRDPRHSNVRLIDIHGVSQRFFPRWSLAYLGTSDDIERQIRLLERAHASGANMVAAALEFAHRIRHVAWQQGHWRIGQDVLGDSPGG